MFNQIRYAAVAAGLMLLTACGSTPNYYIDDVARNQISSTQVIVNIPQKEITAEIDASNVAVAGGGGLLLALVDVAVESSRANTAEELIQPIKDSLIETDFQAMFMTALQEELAAAPWLNVSNTTLVIDPVENHVDSHYRASEAEAVLFIDASYALGANFDSMKGYAVLSMLPKSDTLKQYSEKAGSKKSKTSATHPDNLIYRDSIAVNRALSSISEDKEVNAAKWAEQPAVLQAELQAIAKLLAASVVRSLDTKRAPTA
ncbi:hypothetical protein [Alteromonas sp. H39]|uniref:hypothetical protein n=1 Tax=Alteromonas sp. H39 TaxID=3389876 RepID=UPI0039DF4CE6